MICLKLALEPCLAAEFWPDYIDLPQTNTIPIGRSFRYSVTGLYYDGGTLTGYGWGKSYGSLTLPNWIRWENDVTLSGTPSVPGRQEVWLWAKNDTWGFIRECLTLEIYDPAQPVYWISSTSSSFGPGGGQETVRAFSYTDWWARSASSWIHVTQGASSAGNGYVKYTVDPNPGRESRSSSVDIGGCIHSVSQAGELPSLSIFPDKLSFGPSGGNGLVTVTADIPWTAQSSEGWVNVTSGASGSGNGTIRYIVGANPRTDARSASIAVQCSGGTRVHTVEQRDAEPALTIAPTNRTFEALGGDGWILVTANTAWTAAGSDAWITIIDGASGWGNGVIGYHVAANPDATSRSGSVSVGNKSHQVAQKPRVTTLAILTDPALPDAVVGTAYGLALAAAGGTLPYAWEVASGQLPPGLTLDGDSGWLSGTPRVAGSNSFTVRLTDAAPAGVLGAFSLVVGDSPSGGGLTLKCQRSADGDLQILGVDGTSSSQLTLEWSPDARDWTPLAAARAGEPFTLSLADLELWGSPRGFVRAKTEEAASTRAPQITRQPQNRLVMAGTPVSFAVQAAGSLPLTYQWRRDGAELHDGGNVAGATTSRLTLQSVQAVDTGLYNVQVGNSAGTLLSTGAVLALRPANLTPALVWIPPGSFVMGSAESEPAHEGNEAPLTEVRLTRGFWLGKFEVTQGEYSQVMESDPSWYTGASNLPVQCVSWFDATNYCARLTARDRALGRLPAGLAYRLPTEAEWEYACRAGTTSATAFGSSLSATQANFDGRYPYNGGEAGAFLDQPTPVGSYTPNAWGVCDMHGNLQEWCQDWYGPLLPSGSVVDLQGPASGLYRLCRGGSYLNPGQFCRSAVRRGATPETMYANLGFRVALAQVEDAPVEAALTVTPASQDFGVVLIGAEADRSFIVSNAGGGTLDGTAEAAAPFSVVSGGSYSLAAGLSQVVTVRYHPAAAGDHSGTVSFSGAGGASRTVRGSAFDGAAQVELTPAFVTVPFSGHRTAVAVSSSGPWAAIVSAPWIAVEDPTGLGGAGQFTLVVDGNPDCRYRFGAAAIGNQLLRITQEPAPPRVALSASRQVFDGAGGTGTVSVLANCAWQADAVLGNDVVNRVGVYGGSLGSGDGSFGYALSPMQNRTNWAGYINVAGTLLGFSQDNDPPELDRYPICSTFPKTGGRGTLRIWAKGRWYLSGGVLVQAPSSGDGDAVVEYTVSPNVDAFGNYTMPGRRIVLNLDTTPVYRSTALKHEIFQAGYANPAVVATDDTKMQVGFFTVWPESVQPDSTFSVQARIRHVGSKPSSKVFVTMFTNNTPAGVQAPWYVYVNSMQPGEERDVVLPNIQAGPYYGLRSYKLSVVGRNEEWNSDNFTYDTQTVTVRVGPQAPNYIVSDLRLAFRPPAQGQFYDAFVTVANAGGQAGAAGNLALWYTPTLPRCGQGALNLDAGALAPGESRVLLFPNLPYDNPASGLCLALVNSQGDLSEWGNAEGTLCPRGGDNYRNLKLSSAAVRPTVVGGERSVTLPVGAPLLLSADVTGNPPPLVQWRKNKTNVVESEQVVGARFPVLYILKVAPQDAGGYSVVASNFLGMVTGVVATVSISQGPVGSLPSDADGR